MTNGGIFNQKQSAGERERDRERERAHLHTRRPLAINATGGERFPETQFSSTDDFQKKKKNVDKMRWLVFCALMVLSQSRTSDGGKVLVYPYGHCLNSHLLNAEKLARIISESGHEVFMLVSTSYDRYAHRTGGGGGENLTSGASLIQFASPPHYKPVCEYDTMDFMLYAPIRDRFRGLIQTAKLYCDALLSDKALLRRIKDAAFDLAIVESLDPCSKILVDYLDVPFMPLITAGLGQWDGNPRPPSYIPAVISPFTSDMSFFQRLANFVMKITYENTPSLLGFDSQFEALKEKHGLNTSLKLSETFERASLKLVNSDFSIDYPAPIEPDTVLIGGFAVDHPPPPLSRDLEQFIRSSGEHGVILLSFGTLTKRFDVAWTRLFVEALSRLPQKVIWRFYPSDEALIPMIFNGTVRDKFKLLSWVPQSSVLVHPGTRLFITHCGMNGMFEATHYGVPVVGIPLSGDHFQNAAKLTRHLGMGITVDVFSVDADQLHSAIEEVLVNPKYKDNAKAVSRRVRDQPMDAISKLKFWVDYVIRNHGAPHLKSRAHKLSWIQYYSLDVICFIVSTLLAVVVVIAYLSLILVSKLYSTLARKFLAQKHLKTKEH